MMKEGKFASAIEKIDEARQMAPEDPLTLIGRANAELGASLYRRCDADLHQAFGANPALLMAQYDLKGTIGEDRLQYVVTELKQTASDDPSNPTPLLLLAYVSYNTGNESKAARYLDGAAQRAGGRDELIDALRSHWSFPASDNPATLPSGITK